MKPPNLLINEQGFDKPHYAPPCNLLAHFNWMIKKYE